MRIGFFLGFIFLSGVAPAQNTIGIPNIINYSRQDYRAGSQNWDIKQDSSGITYFANNDGLLSFDGTFWRIYPLPTKRIVRSIAIGPGNRIYVGSQGEIGYFSPGPAGELVYTSLTGLIPKDENDFADVWNVIIFQNHIFFRSNKKVFQLDGDHIIAYRSTNWRFLGQAGDKLIAYEYTNQLVRFEHGAWVPCVKTGALPPLVQVTSVLPIGRDSLLISTLTHGLFILHDGDLRPFETAATKDIFKNYIYKACLVDQDKIAFATNLAGCIILNKKGEFVQRLTKKEGLQYNNILSVFQDKHDNLWLGLDNGVDLITYSNAIRNIFPEQEDRNSGYCSIIFHNQLYLGTSTGVYKARLDGSQDLSYVRSGFEYVQNTTGQIWTLAEVNGHLLMGQNKGAYLIDDNAASPIDETSGFWGFQPLYNRFPSPVVITGTYNGINFYNYEDGKFRNNMVHAHFESSRFVVIDSNVIWVAHPYKGLFKVSVSPEGKPAATAYTGDNNVLSGNHNHLFRVKGRVVLTNDKGIFEYDHKRGEFVRSDYFYQLFGGRPLSYLKEDPYGNIWFCENKKLGVADFSGGKPRLVYFYEINNRVQSDDNEHIYIADSNNIFVAAEKGFFHVNYPRYKKDRQPLQALVRMVSMLNRWKSMLFGGYAIPGNKQASPTIAYKDNSLHFEFSSTLYGQTQNVEYSCYLEGFDKSWLDWTAKREKDYTNLPAGKYTFMVKCRNSIDNESATASFSFTVLPPWYRSVWAYLAYSVCLFLLLFFFYQRQERRLKLQQKRKLQEQQQKYEEEQRQLQYHHQLEIEKNEKEIIRLRNEKLSAELDIEKNEKEIIHLKNEKLNSELMHKNSELASGALSLVQKGELLSKIKEELMRLKQNAEIESESKDFKKIIRIIDRELDNNHDWEQFAVHFDEVHTNYLKSLKEQHPALTSNELKLCAYLRLNLSSKEIAQLMNVSVRGIETNRYRLRKKLGLGNDTNLFDFLLGIKSV